MPKLSEVSNYKPSEVKKLIKSFTKKVKAGNTRSKGFVTASILPDVEEPIGGSNPKTYWVRISPTVVRRVRC